MLSSPRYEQEVTRWLRSPEQTGRRPRKRVLTSDYVLLREPGAQAWVGFRDTFLVDGEPVRNRDDRLERLFREGQADALERARLILEQNARYNLAEDNVHRTINAPTLTLDLLHPRHRSRFSFRQHGQDTIDGQRVWKVDFTEHTRPSLIQTPGGAGQVTRGTAWIDPATGSILRTYLNVVISDRSTEAKVTVNYPAGLYAGIPRALRDARILRTVLSGDPDGGAVHELPPVPDQRTHFGKVARC